MAMELDVDIPETQTEIFFKQVIAIEHTFLLMQSRIPVISEQLSLGFWLEPS